MIRKPSSINKSWGKMTKMPLRTLTEETDENEWQENGSQTEEEEHHVELGGSCCDDSAHFETRSCETDNC